MATRRIREFLDGSFVRYVIISHSPAYTARETAQSTHISGRKVAKTVIVRIDGKLAMAVVAADKEIELELLRRQAGAKAVVLARPTEFADRFLGCQVGAAPPFGNLFGLETFVDQGLLCQEEIAFPAGTHGDVAVMRVADYERLVQPTRVQIAVEPPAHRAQQALSI